MQKIYGGKAITNKYVFFFYETDSEGLTVIGSWFQIIGIHTEKACLPKFS